jgi:HAMP domain-containing protein
MTAFPYIFRIFAADMVKLPKLITKTLSFRLSLTVIAALATLLMVALLIIFILSRKAVKEEALMDAGQTLEATMQRIDNILLKVEQSSGNIYWKMLPHIHQPEKMALYTRKLVEISPYITDCTITWDADSSAANSIFTGWINSENKTNAITTFRLPLFDGPRKVGDMDVDVSLTLVSKIMLETKPSPNSFCTLLKPDGTVIVHPDSTILGRHIFELTKDDHPSMTEAAQAMLNGETGYKYVRLDGKDFYVFFKPFERSEVIGRAMSKLGWSAGIIYPEEDIFGDYNRLLYIVLLIAAIGLVLLFLTCRLYIHHQFVPLRRLEKSAQRIAEGDYDKTIQYSRRRDEVGRLQNHFSEMQQSLSTRMGEMRRLTDDLKERGEALQATYEQAQTAERMKTNFLYNMSDQMTSPVGDILQRVLTISDRSEQQTEETVDQLVDGIQERGETVTALLNQLITESEKIKENNG